MTYLSAVPVSPRAVLAASLDARMPTWQVAQAILDLGLGVDGDTARDLSYLAERSSWERELSADFARPNDASGQLARCGELFATELSGVDPGDPAALRDTVARLLGQLPVGAHGTPQGALADFSAVNRRARSGDGPRNDALRRRLRALRTLAEKADAIADAVDLRHAQMQAKSRLAHRVDVSACTDATLAFVAYLAARANRRSIFQIGEQSRAQDTISDGLQRLLVASPDTHWSSVALVKPTVGVIERLTAGERGALIGVFHAELARAAGKLGELWPSLPARMRTEMVMVKGVDSSRWNAYAGALNTMRSAWISAVLASGLDEILDRYLPGKAPRLMASDLVWWHRSEGAELHEDTRMFTALPHPWEVIAGDARLTREQVCETAGRLRVDALGTGWVGARAPVDRERPEPEPALVHGVVVSDARLAATLRRCGVFSAKALRHADELPDGVLREVVQYGGRCIPVVIPVVHGA